LLQINQFEDLQEILISNNDPSLLEKALEVLRLKHSIAVRIKQVKPVADVLSRP
jgi:hypothetical protein